MGSKTFCKFSNTQIMRNSYVRILFVPVRVCYKNLSN